MLRLSWPIIRSGIGAGAGAGCVFVLCLPPIYRRLDLFLRVTQLVMARRSCACFSRCTSAPAVNEQHQIVLCLPNQSLAWCIAPLLNGSSCLGPQVFYFSVGSNPRGIYLRISERAAGQLSGHNSLVIPSGETGFEGWTILRDCMTRVHDMDSVSACAALLGSGWRCLAACGTCIRCAGH